MVDKQEDRSITLTDRERTRLTWTTSSSRRSVLPSYGNSLVHVNTRMRTCETCGKLFLNQSDLRQHVALTHTGKKPIVCSICNKRYRCRHHMTSHYRMHEEPRLEEFNILMKRTPHDVISVCSNTTTTAVGSFQHVPKALKAGRSDYTNENGSFGTHQTFNVKSTETKLMQRKAGLNPSSHTSQQLSRKVNANANTPTNLNTNENLSTRNEHTVLPPIHSVRNENKAAVNCMGQSAVKGNYVAERSKEVSQQRLPSIDPGSISVIDSVTGISKTIQTNEKSDFTRKSEDQLIRSRLEAISLANRHAMRSHLSDRMGSKQKSALANDGQPWETESHLNKNHGTGNRETGSDMVRRRNGISEWSRFGRYSDSRSSTRSTFSLPRL